MYFLVLSITFFERDINIAIKLLGGSSINNKVNKFCTFLKKIELLEKEFENEFIRKLI